MPIVHSRSFRPAWWLANPHLQTLWPALLRRKPRLDRVRERLATADGDFIDVDWCGDGSKPLVLLLHGLSGSSASPYILGMQAVLKQQGLHSVALNFRGCGGQPNRSARCYHSGDTEDVDFLYRLLRQRHPHTPLAAVGYSLGGNVLLKWLGEGRAGLDLFAAAAVSVPMLLNLCSSRMDQGFSKFYRNQLLKELKQYVKDKQHYLHSIGAVEESEKLRRLGDLSPLNSFWQYDDRVIAGLYPFRDVQDYYARSSSRQFLKTIATPTLIIHAQDDPFMNPGVVPTEAELADAVQLELLRGGGHVGFVAGGWPGRPRYWLEERVPAFIQRQLARRGVV